MGKIDATKNPLFAPHPEGGRGWAVWKGRGVSEAHSVEDTDAELPRVVVVVVAVPLLSFVVEFSPCAAGRPRSMVDEALAAVK